MCSTTLPSYIKKFLWHACCFSQCLLIFRHRYLFSYGFNNPFHPVFFFLNFSLFLNYYSPRLLTAWIMIVMSSTLWNLRILVKFLFPYTSSVPHLEKVGKEESQTADHRLHVAFSWVKQLCCIIRVPSSGQHAWIWCPWINGVWWCNYRKYKFHASHGCDGYCCRDLTKCN